MDEERDFKNAADRAETYLESMLKTKGSVIHVYDYPQAVIRDMITDLMHYAYRRNAGKSPDDMYYIDVPKIFEQAQKQFISERERIPLTFDSTLEELHKALSERQQQERTSLILQQGAEAKKLGDSPELHEQHQNQFAMQEKKFAEERKQYVQDYHQARALADDLERREKIDDLTLDASPKRTKMKNPARWNLTGLFHTTFSRDVPIPVSRRCQRPDSPSKGNLTGSRNKGSICDLCHERDPMPNDAEFTAKVPFTQNP